MRENELTLLPTTADETAHSRKAAAPNRGEAEWETDASPTLEVNDVMGYLGSVTLLVARCRAD